MEPKIREEKWISFWKTTILQIKVGYFGYLEIKMILMKITSAKRSNFVKRKTEDLTERDTKKRGVVEGRRRSAEQTRSEDVEGRRRL